MTNPFTGRLILPFLANRKTYLAAGAIIVLGVLQAFGIHVPDWVMWIAGGSAVAAHRASIMNIANAVDDLGTLVTYAAQSSAQQKVAQVSQTTEYKNSPTEGAKTDLLNQSQLKGN